MMTIALLILTTTFPVLLVAGLLVLAEWRDRRHAAMLARQIRLTDALAEGVGPVVAPLVSKPVGRPWRVEMRVPVGRPAVVSRIVAIAHEILVGSGAGRYELVLTPAPVESRPSASAGRPVRRLQAA